MPTKECIVCTLKAENNTQIREYLGKMMKHMRLWLKENGLRAAGNIFAEIYYPNLNKMELWVSFKQREEKR